MTGIAITVIALMMIIFTLLGAVIINIARALAEGEGAEPWEEEDGTEQGADDTRQGCHREDTQG